ncbi:MAG: ectoine/hydroxyectoine ABC transporter substrate-binding protein EhuB [Anaerolineales bacterium]
MNTRRKTLLFSLGAVMMLIASACAPQVETVEVEVTREVEVPVEVVEEVEVPVEVEVTREVEVEVPAEPEEETTLERIQREGVVRVGFANENPYAFAKPDGTLSGEAVEVARAIFTSMGIAEMEGVLTEFGSLIPGLQAGRFDAITAGMYIKPERCEQVVFADPEYTIGEGLIVTAGNPFDLHSYEDIAANPDVRVGTGQGYFEEQYMTSVGVSPDQITLFPDDPSGVAGIQAGQIDAWTGTAPTLTKLLETTGDSNLEFVTDFTQPIIDGASVAGFGGAAFRYEDVDLRNAFNTELQNLKDEGVLVDIIGVFEGFGPETLPGDTTVSDLCPGVYDDVELAP